MKKTVKIILPLICALFFLASCGQNTLDEGQKIDIVTVPGLENETASPTAIASEDVANTPDVLTSVEPVSPEASPSEEPLPTREPDPVIPIGIYTCKGSNRELTDTYTETFKTTGEPKSRDIKTFNFFLSNEPVIAGNDFGSGFRAIYKEQFDEYPEFNNPWKVGYKVTYVLKEGENLEFLITKAEDVTEDQPFFEYVEIWSYDAYHQTGHYSHLLPADMKDDTVITQLKFTSDKRGNEVSEIIVTAFLYDNWDTDLDYENNSFTADNTYTLHIYNE